MTAIDFRCPACGHATQVTPEYCGQTGPCARCGSTVTVPRAPGDVTPLKNETSILGRGMLIVLGTSIALLIGAVLAMTGVKLIEPIARGMVVASHHRESKDNLKRIAAALLAYEQKYGSLPPAAIKDSKGKPLHSWRVLILPFLGPSEKALYEQYNFSEPWDGLQNTAMHPRMPAVFGSSRDQGRAKGETNYFLITGKSTLFADGKSQKVASLQDPAKVALVVEATNQTGASWLEPRDFAASSLNGRLNSGASGQLNGLYDDGIYIATADGEPRFIEAELSPDELRALMLGEE